MRLRLCPCGVVLDAKCSACNKCGRGKQRQRQGTTEAGYGWDWQQLQQRFIKEHPLCAECAKQDKATAAEEVHHIIPIADAPWLRLEWNNLMSLCVPCHRSIDEARRQTGGRS